jgi:pimeloyl-ACP methyl ester carboxylesterase
MLKNDRTLLASFSFAKTKTKRWIVFLTESGSDFRKADRNELKNLVGARVSRHFNFLIINKPGLSPKGTSRKEFEKSFRRLHRIEDSLLTMKTIIPKNHEIHLVGYSEGAYLAPQVARRDKRVSTVSMIGGGTRGWLKEELNTASPKEKKSYEKKIKEIYRHPNSLEKWNGFSYATWYSYRGDNTLQALKNLRRPTLAILGARDTVIDLRSTIVDMVLISENQPIHIHIFGDCGHYFSKHWSQVELVLGRFLTDNVL